MEGVSFIRATTNEIPGLCANRIAFLRELTGEGSDEEAAALKSQLEAYFEEALESGEYVSWLAVHEENIIGAGGMVMRRQPGSFRNPSGKVGYIMNMYVLPDHRRRGISAGLLEKLIAEGKQHGVTMFELHATQEGEPVYVRRGFKKHGEPTYRLSET
jgi:GNAT superfamily N-acetyltransferase